MIAVNTDASFREDLARAGIAYTGPIVGHDAQVIDATDTMQAELCAIALAMAAAHTRGLEHVTFRHDADIQVRLSLRSNWVRSGHKGLLDARRVVARMLAAHPGWRLKQIPRGQNVHANILARRALKLETAGLAQRSHLERAEHQEAAAA
jgi:ribonuclease HI